MTSAITQAILASIGSKLRPITDERIANTPHTVSQPGLTRHGLGDEAFEAAMEQRRVWIRENCESDVLPEALCQNGRLIGRLYRFEDPKEAFFFKLRFG